jgi:hypothetical protein
MRGKFFDFLKFFVFSSFFLNFSLKGVLTAFSVGKRGGCPFFNWCGEHCQCVFDQSVMGHISVWVVTFPAEAFGGSSLSK